MVQTPYFVGCQPVLCGFGASCYKMVWTPNPLLCTNPVHCGGLESLGKPGFWEHFVDFFQEKQQYTEFTKFSLVRTPEIYLIRFFGIGPDPASVHDGILALWRLFPKNNLRRFLAWLLAWGVWITNTLKEKLKGQQPKGKIVSALFHTFSEFFPHIFTPFSEFLRIFPPRLFLRIKGFYCCFSSKIRKENKRE